MSSENQGPANNVSLEQFTQSTMRNAQNGGRVESAKSFDDLINQILEGPVRWISNMTGLNVTNALSTGIFANVKIEDGAMKFVNDSINKGAQSFTANGGVFAREGSIVANKENMFAGVTQNAIESLPVEAMAQVNDVRSMMGEGMPVAAMSFGDLGGLTPLAAGGTSRGMDMTV